jgi:hypothetical protein
MTTHEPELVDGLTLDERLSLEDYEDVVQPYWFEGDRQKDELRQAYEDAKTAAKELREDPQFRHDVGAAMVTAGFVLIGYTLIKRRSNKREAARLAKTFFDLRVTKDQVALLQSADVNVLFDTPFGQLLLAAVPPAQG